MKINNLKNLINQFCIDAKEFSFGVAIGRFRKDFPLGKWEKRRTFYENRVYKYLEKRYAPLIKSMAEEYDESKKKPVNKKLIWVMWWQGEESMPEVVKLCYNRLRKVATDCEIHLITQDNYAEYVNLPKCVIDRFNEGKMSITHLSDVIRVYLLRDYGGVWVDATIYIEYLPDYLFNERFFTLHSPGMFPELIHRGEWSTFFMTAKFDYLQLFCVLCEIYDVYWKKQKRIIDYLMFDFLVKLIINSIPSVKCDIDSIKEDRNFYWLNVNCNNIVDAIKLKRILNNSPLQKLTYKKELLKYDNRQLTNYGWISERDNNE